MPSASAITYARFAASCFIPVYLDGLVSFERMHWCQTRLSGLVFKKLCVLCARLARTPLDSGGGREALFALQA